MNQETPEVKVVNAVVTGIEMTSDGYTVRRNIGLIIRPEGGDEALPDEICIVKAVEKD